MADIIDTAEFRKFKKQSGFTNAQFRQLAGLYSRAATHKALFDMGVDVDFDAGTCSFTYYKSNNYKPAFQFVIRHVGPRADIYEVYKEGKGRIARSGLFSRAFARLEEEITALF